jgi:hypothetical protein
MNTIAELRRTVEAFRREADDALVAKLTEVLAVHDLVIARRQLDQYSKALEEMDNSSGVHEQDELVGTLKVRDDGSSTS